MPSERDQRLRRAEKAVRQGRLDVAAEEYRAILAEAPEDLSVLNALGDLYVRLQRSPEALPLYLRVADVYLREGFHAKAAGFYRKVLKFTPGDELVQARLAEALAEQGLTVEAKAQLQAIAQARHRRGDRAGEMAVLVRIADLDPKDLTARLEAARVLLAAGETSGVDRLAGVVHALEGAGRHEEAQALMPQLLGAALAHGELPRVFEQVVEAVVDAAVERGDDLAAVSMLQAVLAQAPGFVPAASRLVEICIDAHLGEALTDAQVALCSAYEATGQLVEARAVAENLVLGHPDDSALRARLERLLELLGEADPAAAVARLLALEVNTVDEDLVEDEEDSEADTGLELGGGGATEPEASSTAIPASAEQVEFDLTSPMNTLAAPQVEQAGPRRDAEVKPPEAATAAQEITLGQVFDYLRAGATSARQVDGKQQLALGRTYLAAGMVEESRAAFERAARDAVWRAAAAVALGETFEDEDDLAQAIEWFERGADAQQSPEADRLDAMRRLARALEAAHEPDRALAVWLELVAARPDDEEATQRVAVLSTGSGR